MDILYYSNSCQHSKQLLGILSKSNIQKKFYYICIDKRSKDSNNNIIIQLDNGQNVPLPPVITKVPSLLLQNHGNRVLSGGEIMNYINQKNREVEIVKDEPQPFGFGGNNYVCSDNFSFLDMNAEDLQSKGSGGTRQMHHYVTLNENQSISTPADNYVPDKVGNGKGMTIEQLQEERAKDVYNNKMPYS